MYWIQETGDNHNTGNYKLFYCESESDIHSLPNTKVEGVPQVNDSLSHKKVGCGSECFCIATGSVYVLTKNDNWKLIGGGD